MKVICVKHTTGWCATLDKKNKAYEDSIKTKCGHVVIFPIGIERGEPTCEECLKIIKKDKP